jgi:hypothetical protein
MPETDPLPRRLERRLALVKAHVDCENRHDFEGILRTFGTSVAYEDQAWRRVTLDRRASDNITKATTNFTWAS